jgi:hypothetical protein
MRRVKAGDLLAEAPPGLGPPGVGCGRLVGYGGGRKVLRREQAGARAVRDSELSLSAY